MSAVAQRTSRASYTNEMISLDLARKIEGYTGQDKSRSYLAAQVEAIRRRSKELQERYDTFLGPQIAEAIGAAQGDRTNARFPRRAEQLDVLPEEDEHSIHTVTSHDSLREPPGTYHVQARSMTTITAQTQM